MAESYGWAGKILRVDLTTGEITTQDDAKYHKYIGGMGMAYRIMYEEAPMDLDPYDEKAQVIFGVGPLTGAGVPCSGRMNVTFRSTWSKGSSIIDAHMGGHIGPMLKYAGWDGIVITGISAKPVYLRIEDDEVSSRMLLTSGARVRSRPTSGWWSRTAVSSRPLPSALPVRIWWTTPP